MARRDVNERIFELALSNDGAIARQQLLDLDISAATISRRVSSGTIEPVLAGYYVVSLLRSPTSAASAVLLGHPAGAFSHFTATELLAWRPSRSGVPAPHIVVEHGASVQVPGVVVHETRHLPEVDVVTVDGRRVTSPARTICDLAPLLTSRRLLHVVETQLAARSPSPDQLIACCEARRRRRVAGTRRLARMLGELVDDEPFPESKLEIMVLDGLERFGIDGLRRQFRPPWYEGVRGVVDAADPIGRTIVECDGRRFRQVTQAHDNDRQRDRVATSYGWATVRVGWRELERDGDEVLGEIARIIEVRRGQAERGAGEPDDRRVA